MVDLDRLRAIGWTNWNPIGLQGPPETPADEYDKYLIRAAEMLAAGASAAAIVDYLVRRAEIDMMMAPADRDAAAATEMAIRSFIGA